MTVYELGWAFFLLIFVIWPLAMVIDQTWKERRR